MKREPKIVENSKQALMLRGVSASNISVQFDKDLVNSNYIFNQISKLIQNSHLQHALKRMQSTYFGKKHPFNPFEDITPVEELFKKYNQSLFAFCSHNKKIPDNVMIGKIVLIIF